MDSKTEADLISKLQLFNENYERMEELFTKLVVLDYSKLLLSQYKLRPIHKYYFSTVTNSGEQFNTFVCLATWLINDKCKIQLKNAIPNPEEYEDPNVYIYSILDALRSMGKSVEFSPNKLKQGYGAEVIYILNCFADKALERVEFPNQAQINILNNSNFDMSNLDGKEQNEYVEDDEEEDQRYLFDNQQYTVIDDDDEDSASLEENLNELETASNRLNSSSLADVSFATSRLAKERPINGSDHSKNANPLKQLANLSRPIMRPSLDSREWEEEFQQMLPQLKLANRLLDQSGGNNWRIRFDELKKRNTLINTELSQCNEGLGKLELDVQKSLDRLESRERYVQQQMDALCNELLAYRSELARSMENYQQINGGVISKSRRLAELNEQIQRVKAKTEKREQWINDKTPLLQIRKALTKLKVETNDLNIRIGVALRNVMHQNLEKAIQKNEFTGSHDAFGQLYSMPNQNQDLRPIY